MKTLDILKIIGNLNAFKVALKTAHWNETESYNKHEQLDNLYKVLDEFQDNFVEECKILYNLKIEEVPTNVIYFSNINELTRKISKYVINIKINIDNENEKDLYKKLSGLNGLCDSLIHDINIIKYRLQME